MEGGEGMPRAVNTAFYVPDAHEEFGDLPPHVDQEAFDGAVLEGPAFPDEQASPIAATPSVTLHSPPIDPNLPSREDYLQQLLQLGSEPTPSPILLDNTITADNEATHDEILLSTNNFSREQGSTRDAQLPQVTNLTHDDSPSPSPRKRTRTATKKVTYTKKIRKEIRKSLPGNSTIVKAQEEAQASTNTPPRRSARVPAAPQQALVAEATPESSLGKRSRGAEADTDAPSQTRSKRAKK